MTRKAPHIARRAQLACEKWREYFKQNIDAYHLMLTFVYGQQWTQDEEDEMLKTYKKVPMVANHLAAMANVLLGEQQQNTPQLEVVPMSNCDEEVATLRELIVKDIMFSSKATTCYQTSAAQAFIGGFSAFMWDTEYTSRGFDLDFVPRFFKDATRTYYDISSEEINKTDGMHSGYITRMSRTKFRQMYGKKLEKEIVKFVNPVQDKETIALAVQPTSNGDDPFTWADDQAITIIDHFERKYKKDTLYKLSNSRTYTQSEMEELVKKSQQINQRNQQMQMRQIEQAMTGMQGGMRQPNEYMPEGFDAGAMQQQEMNPESNQVMMEDETEMPMESEKQEYIEPEEWEFMTLWDDGEPVRIEDKREIKDSIIMHYKIAGEYVLDENEFPSKQLPIVFVDHNSYYDKNGKQMCRSFFGDVKDTQKFINYLRTQSAFILKISRYDQYMGSKKNVQGLDTQRAWADPSSVHGMIPYDESPNGNKPEPLRPPELSQSLFQQYQLAVEDLYRCTGLYPARMGQEGNEISGAAIDARTRQGSYSTYVAFNSINRAISVGGEIINEMIPYVYDAERVITLMTPDSGRKNIIINEQKDDYGMLIENDIRKGVYQVRLKPGPSYESQKQIALESLRMLLEADPQTFKLVADLYAENLPLSNSIEIKNRLKTIVPPDIIQAGKSGEMPQQQNGSSPEQQAMQMQQQQIQMDMQMKQQELQVKQMDVQIKEKKIQADYEIAMAKIQAEKEEMAGQIQEQELRYLAETQRTQSDEAIANADNLVRILTHKI
jgi:hypothetical protein